MGGQCRLFPHQEPDSRARTPLAGIESRSQAKTLVLSQAVSRKAWGEEWCWNFFDVCFGGS
jgi:hypothetical protein